MIFAYDRCTLEEIMARAEEELSGFELTDEQKNAISHRGKALRAMAAWLQEHAGK